MPYPLAVSVAQCELSENHVILRLNLPHEIPEFTAGHTLQISLGGKMHALVLMRTKADWIEGIMHRPPVWQDLPPTVEILACQGAHLQVQRALPLLVGDGIGSASLIVLAESLKNQAAFQPLVLLSAESLPFAPRPSQIYLKGMPAGVIAAIPLLEDWKIASRLASTEDAVGCFEGSVTELAAHWLAQLQAETLQQVEIIAAGKPEFLNELAQLAARYAVPFQNI
ncbi:MAG: hypothetical protein PHP00_11300 [Thiotrichaceae bacterium]|nr:hypothetical protein [Thiotrichaceae bacterium]